MIEKNFRLCAFADEASSSLAGQIEALQRNGITLLEIRGVDGKNIADMTVNEVREVKNRLDDAGISVWSIGSPIGKYSLDKPLAPHLEVFKKILDFAEILECRRVRMFSFYPGESVSPERAYNQVCEGLFAFCGLTPENILLCHENEKQIYGETPEKCLELLKAFPRLRAVFDPANFVQCGENTEKAWEKLSPYIEYMHIKDALPDGTVVPAGFGAGNIPSLLCKYLMHGGEILTLEPHLFDFIGLKALENGRDSEHALQFESQDSAFDAAVGALKKLINEL